VIKTSFQEIRGFVILMCVKEKPILAACELCQMKFFLPSNMKVWPEQAELYLRQKYINHACKGY
jgi:hypothetical protein